MTGKTIIVFCIHNKFDAAVAFGYYATRSVREIPVKTKLIPNKAGGTPRYRGQRGKQKAPTKIPVSIRLEREVLEFYKSRGAGWQTRVSDMLKAIVEATR